MIDPTEEFDGEHLTLRMGGANGTTPVALVNLVVAGGSRTQILTAVLRPDLPSTVIASQWASGLGLSPGGAAIMQLVVRDEEPWGPAEYVVPTVDASLDTDIEHDGTGGLLLGCDFLKAVWVTYMSAVKLVIITHSSEES